MVAVPLGSLVVAHSLIAVAARRRPGTRRWRRSGGSSTPRFLADGALSNTLIAATPLAFTGLAAAVAFRMRLFNIGAEGQLYFGAIGAAGIALLARRPVTAIVIVAR